MGGPAVSLASAPETIHDFGGFDRALYGIRYAAPGAPGIAERAAQLLEAGGFAVKRSEHRGLDHGAWVPLSLMYPDADIPVAQISLIRGAGPREHHRMGAALAPLREEDVLVIGSGAITHNLFEIWGHSRDAAAPPWVGEFVDWMADALAAGDLDRLFDYRRLAPYAARNHPSEEHLLPLFAALGAGGRQARASRLHTSYTYGILAMDAFGFGEGDRLAKGELDG